MPGAKRRSLMIFWQQNRDYRNVEKTRKKKHWLLTRETNNVILMKSQEKKITTTMTILPRDYSSCKTNWKLAMLELPLIKKKRKDRSNNRILALSSSPKTVLRKRMTKLVSRLISCIIYQRDRRLQRFSSKRKGTSICLGTQKSVRKWMNLLNGKIKSYLNSWTRGRSQLLR